MLRKVANIDGSLSSFEREAIEFFGLLSDISILAVRVNRTACKILIKVGSISI